MCVNIMKTILNNSFGWLCNCLVHLKKNNISSSSSKWREKILQEFYRIVTMNRRRGKKLNAKYNTREEISPAFTFSLFLPTLAYLLDCRNLWKLFLNNLLSGWIKKNAWQKFQVFLLLERTSQLSSLPLVSSHAKF